MVDHPLITLNPPSLVDQLLDRTQLERYFDLLMAENAKVNLVSRETSRQDLVKLAAESVLPLSVTADSFGSYLDIGSGGGFPAIPLLLSRRISGEVVLCERTKKKAAALERIIVELNLKARIVPQDFVEIAWGRKFDLITLRYVRLEPKLLDQIMKLLTGTGLFVHYSDSASISNKYSAEQFQFTDPADSVTKSFTLFRIS